MNILKKGIALFLCIVMCIPSIPAAAESMQRGITDVVKFNTGSYEYCVVDEHTIDELRNEYMEKYGEGDTDQPDAVAAMEELKHYTAWKPDGSFEISIEQDAFFPYEVQFTYNGQTDSKWFLTSDSTVEVAGHTFRLDVPRASGNVVTQMQLNINGDTVIVYPEKKEFSNNEGSQENPASLLPLTEKRFTANLQKYTPVEMTKITFASLFMGNENEMPKGTSIMWKDDDVSGMQYTVNSLGDVIDLSGFGSWFEMIVGENDQLEAGNIRYKIHLNRPSVSEWLRPSLYVEKNGSREEVTLNSNYYSEYGKRLNVSFVGSEEKNYYLGLSLNEEYFTEPQFSELKVFEGEHTEADLAGAKDITGEVWRENIAGDGGYPVTLDWGLTEDQWFTFVTYKDGKITGCLPVQMDFIKSRPGVSIGLSLSLYLIDAENKIYITDDYEHLSVDGVEEYTITLKEGYAANGTYTLGKFVYYVNGKPDSDVSGIKAYIGKYSTIAEAEAAQAQEVKEELFEKGYASDFSNGVTFSIFIGTDGEQQKKYYYRYKTVEAPMEPEVPDEPAEPSEPSEPSKNSQAYAYFNGVAMQTEGSSESITIPSYILGSAQNDFDSYGDGKFFTVFVDKKVTVHGKEQAIDLKNLALKFSLAKGAKLYAEGQQGEEESGKSFHDFSKKAIQFTATSEDGNNHTNYFVRLIQVKGQDEAQTSPPQLYINSLDDVASKTVTDEQGVIASTREVFLDSYHNNVHDILVSNIGYQTMAALKVELTGAQDIELDPYWTLQGKNGLSGLTSIQKVQDAPNGELSNLAIVRLKAKEGELEAKEYGQLGTLTFKSGDQTKMVLSLTGIVGDPRIITKEIKNPTKYVPYGTMIMNNNKYDWNRVTYRISAGKLPEGMMLMPSGELYGVPKEAGDFEITISMQNSYYKFADSVQTIKFTVLENTDDFVDSAEDTGYKLTKRISGIYDTTASGDYEIISEGVFDEYTDLYIDGEKLEKDKDYQAESGSTRITIAAQSLPKSEGVHTIGVEFRQERSQGRVKAAAQNYRVVKKSSGSSSGSSNGATWYPGAPNNTKPNTSNNSGSSVQPDDNSGTGGNAGNSGSGNQPGSTGSNTNQPGSTGSNTNQGGTGTPTDTSVDKAMLYARSYTVKEGDTLRNLAKKYYGKSSKWKKIYHANKKKLSSASASQKLKKGMKLQIPAINYTVKKGDTIKDIAKKYFGARSKWKQIYQINQDVIPSSLKLKEGSKLVIPVPVVCMIYTVKTGDTLEKIAKKFYGKSSKWIKIYNANKNKITASKKVKAGKQLFIPAMTYAVKKGDDIKSIAKKYYGTESEWRQIYHANKDLIPASKKLKVGITLVLPVPVDIG